ncbi:MAG: hypothetical protein NVSMB29_13900 [Candidatus Dormibacteria bacterium]
MTAGDLPAALAERPVDPRFSVPVPFVNERSDGSYDFSSINGRRSIQCALSRICALCGRALEYDLAFLGDALAAEAGSYTQPPMHVSCAEAALRLCPHLAQPGRSHRGGKPVDPKVVPLRRSGEEAGWTMLIASSFEIERPADRAGARLLLFHPGVARELRKFRFHDGVLREVT